MKNYSRGGQPIGTDCHVGLGHRVPPNQVKAAVLETLREIPDVLAEPPPHCRTTGYEDSAIRYQIRFFARDLDTSLQAMEQLYTRLWYRFARDGIEIPFAQRVVHLRSEAAERAEAPEELMGLLHSVDLLALLPPDQLRALARELAARTGQPIVQRAMVARHQRGHVGQSERQRHEHAARGPQHAAGRVDRPAVIANHAQAQQHLANGLAAGHRKGRHVAECEQGEEPDDPGKGQRGYGATGKPGTPSPPRRSARRLSSWPRTPPTDISR